MNRIAIFVLFCEKGIVEKYIKDYIKNLLKVAKDVIIVINGYVCDEGKKELGIYSKCIINRDNIGFDFGAWKEVISSIGVDKIKEIDELILCNSSCYCLERGLSSSFEKMKGSDCDFWGMTKHNGNKNVKNPLNKNEYLLPHLQSYFLVFRKKVISSLTFKKYWGELKLENCWQNAVWKQEIKLTRFFEEQGFKSGVCYPVDSMEYDPTFYSPVELLNDGCPLIKRKLFYSDSIILQNLGRNNAVNVLEKIRLISYCTYEIIWQDLIDNRKMSAIDKNLHLLKIVSDEIESKNTISRSRIAVIVFGYYIDQVNYVSDYLMNLPENTVFYFVSSKVEVLNDYSNRFSGVRKFETLVCPNRGRDLGALLTVTRKVFENFDIVCCAKDKKSPHAAPVYARDFNEHCFESLYRNKIYCRNVIQLFAEYPKLGMIEPLPFNTFYFSNMNNKMGGNERYMRDLVKELNINSCFDEAPLAPFGSMFYVRTKAMRTLLSKKWCESDFPQEPIPSDGTLLHAIERIFPMAVQNDGYFTLQVAPSKIIASYLNTYVFREESIGLIIKQNVKRLNFFKLLKYIVVAKFSPFKKLRCLYCEKLKMKLLEI